MTAALSHEAQSFLEAGRCVSVDLLRCDSGVVPQQPGIYGWWFDDALRQISAGCHAKDGFRLLYIGIAPSAPPKDGARMRTLRDRLLNHCRGPMATSTLRRTLAAILKEQENLSIRRLASRKSQMSGEDEAKLTRWMAEHARVSWLMAPAPWTIERDLLKHGPRLPLNIRGSSDPFRRELMQLRAGSVLLPGPIAED